MTAASTAPAPVETPVVDELLEGACPSCGTPTRFEGWWCMPCIKSKVAAARAGSCRCAVVPGPHTHPTPTNEVPHA